MNYHNRPNVVGVLADDLAFPIGTTGDSTNMVEIGGSTNGQLMLSIFAGTNGLTVATGQAFLMELQGYTADTAASADSFYSTSNSGGINQASGTLHQEAHMYPIHKTSADAGLAFSAGDLIYECALPDNMLRLVSFDFVQLVTLTDEDLRAYNYDAFIWSKV